MELLFNCNQYNEAMYVNEICFGFVLFLYLFHFPTYSFFVVCYFSFISGILRAASLKTTDTLLRQNGIDDLFYTAYFCCLLRTCFFLIILVSLTYQIGAAYIEVKGMHAIMFAGVNCILFRRLPHISILISIFIS